MTIKTEIRDAVLTNLVAQFDRVLAQAPRVLGPEVTEYLPVFKRGIQMLVKFIRERGHKETLDLLDMLATVPPEKM